MANHSAPIVLLDVPLLYEISLDHACDAVAVVSAPAEVQRDRVLSRGAMTAAEFEMILARQTADSEKRRRADYLILTTSLEVAEAAVKDVLADIQRRIADHA
jgi:dephospho-CoA kinase